MTENHADPARHVTADQSLDSPVRVSTILTLFIPMALSTWLGMLAPPIVNAAIVRAAANTDTALAAYAVARNLIFVLAPFAVMVPNAYLVLVSNQLSRRRYARFMALLALLSAGVGVIAAGTPLYRPILIGAIGLSPTLAEEARHTLLILLLFPPLSIWRGFNRGVLIKLRRTDLLLAGGVSGFITLGVGALVAGREASWTGARYGAIVLVASAAVDALVLQIAAAACHSTKEDAADESGPAYGQIARFFLPLVVTTWIMGFSRTIIDAGLARTAAPEISLAAFSVAASVVFAFESPVVSIRSAVLAFPHTPFNCRRLRGFSLAVGAVMTGLIVLLSATGLTRVILTRFIGVTGEVQRLAMGGIWIMAVALMVLAFRQYNYARLMKQERTGLISVSALFRILFLAGALYAGLSIWPDGRMAAIIYVAGFVLETAITYFGVRKAGP